MILRALPFFGGLELKQVHMGSLQEFIAKRLRGLHPLFVFVRAHKKDGEPRPVTMINNTAWKAARERAADTCHPFGVALRAINSTGRSSCRTGLLWVGNSNCGG